MKRCQRCGGRLALVNIDKLQGIVGLREGWIHVSTYGHFQWWKKHAPMILDKEENA